jgi:HAD superfamily hydrolase (TIGR01490 family)
LQQLSVEEFTAAATAVFDEYKDQVYTYTRDLITKLKAQGYFLLAISGSQKELVQKMADYYGFDDCVGTVYAQQDGRFTGQKTLGSADKRKVLKEFITTHHLSLNGSYAVGDSESDIPMLRMVEYPIAFNPTQALFEAAKSSYWKIVVERKNVIYKLEPSHGTYLLA